VKKAKDRSEKLKEITAAAQKYNWLMKVKEKQDLTLDQKKEAYSAVMRVHKYKVFGW